MKKSIVALLGLMISLSCSMHAQWIDDGGNKIRTDNRVSIVPTNANTGQWHPNTSYQLSIDGFFAAAELRVALDNDWPDYVFQKDYQLLSITKLAEFISDNGHLPGLPSTTEVAKSELGLGEAHRLLMEKTEELALYLIQSHQRKKLLLAEIERLENLVKK